MKKNLLANFLGKGTVAFLTLIATPVYLSYMGVENFGLVGFYNLVFFFSTLLDMGFSTGLSREFAKGSNQTIQQRNLLFSLERIFFLIPALFFFLFSLFIHFLGDKWFTSMELAPNDLKQALYLLGIAVGVGFPFTLYLSGLRGLQKQVTLNLIQGGCAFFRVAITLVFLSFLKNAIHAFFYAQILSSLLLTLVMRFYLWNSLPVVEKKPSFDKKAIKRILPFSSYAGGGALLALFLTQMDKLVLSKMAPLKILGIYTLCQMISNGLDFVINPFFSTFYPKYCEEKEEREGKEEEKKRLSDLYHNSCKALFLLLFPLALTLSFFSYEILFIWTGNEEIARSGKRFLSLLVIGTMINGITSLPFAMQLAKGLSKINWYQNLIASSFYLPLLFISFSAWGPVAMPVLWIGVNLGFFLITIPIMHRKILQKELFIFYKKDVLRPLLHALFPLLFLRFFTPIHPSIRNPILFFIYILFSLFLSFLFALYSLPEIRKEFFGFFSKTHLLSKRRKKVFPREKF